MGYPVGNLRQLSRGRRRCRRRRLPPLRPFSAAVPPLPSFLLRLQKNCKCGLLQAVKGFRRIRRIKRKEGCSSGSSSSDDDASSSNYVIVATSAISTRHVSLRPRQVSSPPRRRGRSHLLLHLPPPPTQECTMASLHLSPVSPHHLPPPPGAELFIPKTRTWTLPQDLCCSPPPPPPPSPTRMWLPIISLPRILREVQYPKPGHHGFHHRVRAFRHRPSPIFRKEQKKWDRPCNPGGGRADGRRGRLGPPPPPDKEELGFAAKFLSRSPPSLLLLHLLRCTGTTDRPGPRLDLDSPHP